MVIHMIFLFNFIFITFCNLHLSRQHILEQDLMARSKSQQRISTICLGARSEFKMKQWGQCEFELQIQVKHRSLLQTTWLAGSYSSCAFDMSSRFHLSFECVESKEVLSCPVFRGNLSFFVRRRVCRLLITSSMGRENPCMPSLFSSNRHHLSLEVICCFRGSDG